MSKGPSNPFYMSLKSSVGGWRHQVLPTAVEHVGAQASAAGSVVSEELGSSGVIQDILIDGLAASRRAVLHIASTLTA